MKEKNKEKIVKKERTPVIAPSIEELIEGHTYIEEQDCFKLSSGYYIDIFNISTKDLKNAPDEEIDFDIFKYAKYYKMQGNDIKIISSNFPSNTEKQQNFVKYKMERNKNPFLLEVLARKHNELTHISKHRVSSEYYLFIYEERLDELLTSRIRLVQILQTTKRKMVNPLDIDKRVSILHKIANKNMIV